MSLKFVFEREEASQIAKADTEASNLAELDFYQIIEICIHMIAYMTIFFEQVVTGEYVICGQP